jgi:hypothetical protein
MSVSLPKRSSAAARLTEMPPRKLATITGLLWIATFITSIPAVLLYDPLLNDKDFILGAGGGDARIFIGATLELLLIIANIGTAVRRTRCSSATTSASRWASSPPASSSAGSSRSASSASWRT